MSYVNSGFTQKIPPEKWPGDGTVNWKITVNTAKPSSRKRMIERDKLGVHKN